MGVLFGAGPSLPYQERVAILQSVGVALLDRPGSLDASITEEVANDFPALFAKHPNITDVFSTAARRRGRFAVTLVLRCAKTATSFRACHRLVPPTPRCDWKPRYSMVRDQERPNLGSAMTEKYRGGRGSPLVI
jgi:hypothetical protein